MRAKMKQLAAIKETLAQCYLFDELTDEELEKVAALCREESYEAGAVIFSEGTPAKDLYVLKHGKVALETSFSTRPGAGKQGTISVISTPGQAFSGSALTGSQLHTTSVRCLQRTEALVINEAQLRSLLADDWFMGYKVMEGLVGVINSRLRHTKETLALVLYIATHDLKAPLAAVQSYIQVMLGGFVGELSTKQRDMLLRSSERIKGLINLIDNILDISRIEATQLDVRWVSLQDVIENSVEDVRQVALEKGLELDINLPEETVYIQGSPDRLQQVVTNLLGNGVKFTKEGTVSLKLEDEDDTLRVEVIDTGVGIAAEELPYIFDDFYKGRSADRRGAGLGLSIARRIVEAHGGKIWAESPCPKTGKGTKFTFTLPKKR
jgi:signal transduction histidine kinase